MNQTRIITDTLHPHTGTQVCGHCYNTATWHIRSVVDNGATIPGLWNDYECDFHARMWWPSLFPVSLNKPGEIPARYAQRCETCGGRGCNHKVMPCTWCAEPTTRWEDGTPNCGCFTF